MNINLDFCLLGASSMLRARRLWTCDFWWCLMGQYDSAFLMPAAGWQGWLWISSRDWPRSHTLALRQANASWDGREASAWLEISAAGTEIIIKTSQITGKCQRQHQNILWKDHVPLHFKLLERWLSAEEHSLLFQGTWVCFLPQKNHRVFWFLKERTLNSFLSLPLQDWASQYFIVKEVGMMRPCLLVGCWQLMVTRGRSVFSGLTVDVLLMLLYSCKLSWWNSVGWTGMCMRAHTHTYTETETHVHTERQVYTHTHRDKYMHRGAHTYIHTQRDIHRERDKYSHTQTHTQTNTHTQRQVYTQTNTKRQTYT